MAFFWASSQNLNAAKLLWDPNPEFDVTGYFVYVRQSSSASPVKLFVGQATSYLIPPYSAGSTIYFNVSATNGLGLESVLSPTVTYTVPTTIRVRWDKSPIPGAVGYRIYYGLLNQTASSVNPGTNLTCLVPVTRGKTYYFYGEARNSAGQVVDGYAQSVFAIPASGAIPEMRLARINKLPQVSLLTPTAGSTATVGKPVSVSATAKDADGTVARVDYYAGSTKIASATAPPYTSSWTPSLIGTYQLSALAVDNLGGTNRTANAGITVVFDPTIARPAAPTGFTALAQGTPAIKLSWTDTSTNETSFQIYRSRAGSAFTRLVTLSANSRAYTNISLIPSTRYDYRVTSFNSGGESAPVSAGVTTLPAL